MRTIAATALLLCLAACKPEAESRPETTDTAKTVALPNHAIVVYYPCNTFRCDSCNAMESLTKAAVLGGQVTNDKTKTDIDVKAPYPELVKAGTLRFESINVDEAPNKQFLETYQTESKLPVIAEIKNGKPVRFTVMPKVWDLLEDDKAFVAYLQKELKGYADAVQSP